MCVSYSFLHLGAKGTKLTRGRDASSVFLTFDIMPALCHAGEALFHTVWFIESMATHVLVVFMIRILPNHLKSRPNSWLIAFPLMVLATAVVLPSTPAGLHLVFAALPAFFFLSLIPMLLAHLLAVEGMKKRSSAILPRSEEAMTFPDPGQFSKSV